MQRVEEILGRAAATIVEASHSRIALTLGTCGLLAGISLYLAATILTVDTDSSRLLSEDMPVGRTNRALVGLFPSLQDNIVVMIEADEADDARETAIELRDLLALQPDRYLEVFLPGYGDYYDDFGIYYLDRQELDDFATRIEGHGRAPGHSVGSLGASDPAWGPLPRDRQ